MYEKNIRLSGIDYSLSDIADTDLDIGIRMRIADQAKINYEIFEYLLDTEVPVEDELIIYIANKVEQGDSKFEAPIRRAGSRIETPLELAVFKDRSDAVILALTESRNLEDQPSAVTRLLRGIAGGFFAGDTLDTLELGAANHVKAEKVRDHITERMIDHTEPMHEEQPAMSLVVEPIQDRRRTQS